MDKSDKVFEYCITDAQCEFSIKVLVGGKSSAAKRRFEKWAKGKQDTWSARESFSGLVCQKGRCILVWFYDWPSPSLLSHELFHVTHRIWEAIDTPLTEDTKEAYAYKLDWLMHEVWKQFYGPWSTELAKSLVDAKGKHE